LGGGGASELTDLGYEVNRGKGGELTAAELEQLGSHGYALALRLLGNRDDAADAVQDALHRLWRSRNRFDARRGELRGWFLAIVRNRCLDMLSRRQRDGSSAQIHWSELADPAEQRPDKEAEQQELIELVARELMAMVPEQREIILLRDYHNLSYAEIAAVLDLPAGTVMSRLHRARMELQRRMQKYR